MMIHDAQRMTARVAKPFEPSVATSSRLHEASSPRTTGTPSTVLSTDLMKVGPLQERLQCLHRRVALVVV